MFYVKHFLYYQQRKLKHFYFKHQQLMSFLFK
nr:MAG TPA: hypothetical protein [Caudoviricetes sp.]DAU00954.1 MAG TPA: hypothetical protein [Caudoviricetes sp.]